MDKQKNPNGIPPSEMLWVTYKATNGDIYYTTSKVNNRDYYYLYKFVDGKAVKLGKSRNPTELEEKYIRNSS
jgi:hypothetical protein